MINWLIEYYNAWIGRAEILLLEGGWIVDGNVVQYKTIPHTALFIYSPTGFWLINLAALFFVGCIIYLLIIFLKRKLKHGKQSHT